MDLRNAVNEYALGRLLADDLPEVALQAIDKGYESPSLYQLAGADKTDLTHLRNLFTKAMMEIGILIPSPTEAGLAVARSIANQVLNRSITPYAGARQIWWEVYTKFPELVRLRPFVGLASEYEDDETHREEYEQMIIDECQAFVSE